jgi:predicted PurR-regulated permease PerM
VAVTAIIPLIGATLGAVISVVVTALANEVWPTAVVLLAFFLIYQQVENYLIAPRVQRSAVDLSAPAVLLAGIIGASIQGLLGALMAIPLVAAIKVVIIEQIEAHERDAAARPRS